MRLLNTSFRGMETDPKLRLIKNRQTIPMVRIAKRTVFRFV